MNEFFTHQALLKNTDKVAELSKQLADFKMLVNGDLSRKASDDLNESSRKVAIQFADVIKGVLDLCARLDTSRLDMDIKVKRLDRLIKFGWIILALSMVEGLCAFASHLH